jgi:lipoprotein-releasing system permease protein
LERTGDIGILKTMGSDDGRILKIFLLEGILIAVYGLIIGIGIATAFNWIQSTWQIIPLPAENYYMTYAPVEPHLMDFVIVTGVTIVLCLLSSIIPARIASRMNPLKVIAFGRG